MTAHRWWRATTGLAAAALMVVVVACAPDRTGDLQTDGAPIDAAVQAAAREAGIPACPDRVAESGSALGAVEVVCLSTGEPVDLASFPGPVLVNVFAHWCEPCREELPLLVRAAEEYGDQITVVGVVFADENPAAAVDLAQETGVTFPLVADPGSALRVPLALRGLPTTVFVVDGQIVGKQFTPYADYGDVVADLVEHLEVSAR